MSLLTVIFFFFFPPYSSHLGRFDVVKHTYMLPYMHTYMPYTIFLFIPHRSPF